MKKIIISAIMGIMAVCGMAQDKVYVHKMDGTAVEYNISEVAEVNFVQGTDIVVGASAVKTGEASNVVAAQATVSAEATVANLTADYKVGIIYSAEGDYHPARFVYTNSAHKDAASVTAEYSVDLSGLTPETKYYYRAYAYNGENNMYGDVKTFTTTALSSGSTDDKTPTATGDVDDITFHSATVHCSISESALNQTVVILGVLFCTDELSDADMNYNNAQCKRYTTAKGDVTDGVYTQTITGLNPTTKYYYRSFVRVGATYSYGDIATFTTTDMPVTEGEYVDLGLSVKWASCNLGATAPELSGSFYAWGETETKSNYSESTSLYYGVEGMEDIAGIDGLDVARTLLGEGYRMPTRSEFSELYNNCDWYWLTYKGVTGYFVQSKSNSNGIFLPAAGCRSGERLSYEGSYGYYWSSTPISGDANDAYNLFFYSDNVRPYDYIVRYYGFPVRPVKYLTINDIADAFKTKYATVLALEEETLTADDRESAKKALSEYSELSSEVKALLVEEKAKLDALIATMPSEALSFVQLYKNGPKWANMNIGATSVTDAGLYFWWGDVQGHAKDESPKFNFDSDNAAITSWDNNEGYVADGKLVAEKDAATQLWGAGYRMPTQAEFADLCNKCTWTWKTNYNGVDKANGYLVQGKGEYASYSIFIPAAGSRNGEGLYGEGSIGYYWSSTPYSGNANSAYLLYFDSDNVDPYRYSRRYYGFPVRPVSEL